MINKVILVGNVGADPEVKRFDSNTPVANFRLATSESYTDKQGNRQTLTEWHSLVAWRGLAEIVEKYVKRGSQLYVEGRLRTRSYDDANGVKRYTTEIVVDVMKLLGRREGEGQSTGSTWTGQAQVPSGQVDEIEAAGNDDLPF